MSLAALFARAARLQERTPRWTACMCIAKAAEGTPDPGVEWVAAHLFFCDHFRPDGRAPTTPFWALPPRRHAERITALWLAHEIAKGSGR